MVSPCATRHVTANASGGECVQEEHGAPFLPPPQVSFPVPHAGTLAPDLHLCEFQLCTNWRDEQQHSKSSAGTLFHVDRDLPAQTCRAITLAK